MQTKLQERVLRAPPDSNFDLPAMPRLCGLADALCSTMGMSTQSEEGRLSDRMKWLLPGMIHLAPTKTIIGPALLLHSSQRSKVAEGGSSGLTGAQWRPLCPA